MGVWIEITICLNAWWSSIVTPFMGVWIEISIMVNRESDGTGHSLYGSVD